MLTCETVVGLICNNFPTIPISTYIVDKVNFIILT